MTSLSRLEFNSFIESTLPDNSSRQISASDLRQSFFNLADSIENFNATININSLNFGTESLRTTFAGEDSFARKGSVGFATEDNSAYGYASLQLTYTGLRNTAIGSYALSCASLGSDNVAVGVNALGGLTVGSGNVSVGNYSLLKKKSGNFNIAIGHGAGYVSHADSHFKFNLGVYPEASGDCETTHTFDKSPLLHGDLSSLQLAIAASGFRGDEKLSVSGNIIPYESGVGFSLGSGEYRWDAYVQDLYVSGNITTQNPVYSLSLSDGFSAPEVIASNETVFISGISGIKTDYDTSSNLMRVSAHPISGYLLQELNLLSGLAPAFGEDDGLIWNVSGWAKQYADGVGVSAGAYTHWRVQDESSVGENITNPSTSENTVTFAGVSGNFTNYRSDTNTLEISAKPISGILHGIIGQSGALVSGWASDTIINTGNLLDGRITNTGEAVSGWANHTIKHYANISGVAVSGWTKSVSGYFEDNFVKNAPGGSYTKWTISDGTTTDDIINLDTVSFGGLSGVETNFRKDTNTLEISSRPLSGVLQEQITDITKENGIIDSKLTSYVTNTTLTDFNNSIFGGGDVLPENSLSGTLHATIDNSGNYLLNLIHSSGNAISGWADYNINYENYTEGALGRVSGYAEDYTDHIFNNLNDQSNPDGLYNHWKLKDGAGNTREVKRFKSVKFTGDKGLQANISDIDGNFGLQVSAEGISGWADSTIYNSGVLVSGALHRIIDSSGDALRHKVDASGNALKNTIDASGTAISGWANYNFFDEDGYVGLVSGWATQTFSPIVPGGSYTHWTISDGTNTDQIQQGDPNVIFGGISGIETNYRGDTDTLEISARPVSGMLQHRIDASGSAISGYYNYHLFSTDSQAALQQAKNSLLDNVILNGYLDRKELYQSGVFFDTRASGNIAFHDQRASGLIATNDSRASGLIDLVSGILTITPGSGLTKVFDGGDTLFHTDGSGNFEKIILRKTGASLLDPVGQLVSTTEGGRNNVINASGYLQVPAVQEHYDLPDPHTVGDSGVYFADSHIYQSNGASWSNPPVIEGFMAEDLDPPTDYLNETSGKIVTRVVNNGVLQAGPEAYVINRDHTFAASGGYFLMAMRVNNEYRPVWSTCSGCPDCP
tara:strand:- start:5030 stop:8395 length:3366 start_codon:yes stop_codon:yes gene_type:complete